MKTSLLISAITLLSPQVGAQGKSNKIDPIDRIAIYGNALYSFRGGDSTLIGHITPMDDLDNVLIGYNPSITNSVENVITGNNVQLFNSNGNFVACNNAELYDVNNTSSSGADSKLYSGANYATVTGDAHEVSGYASFTSGTNNINACEHGVVSGYNNRNGILGNPNQFSNSRVGGHDCVSEGNGNLVEGSYLHAIGNDIILIGTGLSGAPTVVNQSGIYYVNNGAVIQLQ